MKITKDSHVDHALTEAHLAFILERFGARDDGFFIETIELPANLPPLPCGLHGPLMGDAQIGDEECTLEVRANRVGLSRVCTRAPRWVRKLTVIVGPHEGETILYTAFGGPAAPREPFDPSLQGDALTESRLFWSQHALSREP